VTKDFTTEPQSAQRLIVALVLDAVTLVGCGDTGWQAPPSSTQSGDAG